MRGYFVSIECLNELHAFVYEIIYTLDDPKREYQDNLVSETIMEKHDDFVLINPTSDHHLRIDILKDSDGKVNSYFDEFCQNQKCLCDEWAAGESYFPYTVRRFKGDKMFLLLAQDSSTKPVSVKHYTIQRFLTGMEISYK